MGKLLRGSAELCRWTHESCVSSSGEELSFDLGPITLPLSAFIFTPTSLCFDILAKHIGAGTNCLCLHPRCDSTPFSLAVTSWHGANGNSEKSHLPFQWDCRTANKLHPSTCQHPCEI